MEGYVVGGIVQTNVFEVIVAGSTRVFKCGRLKNGYTDSPANKGFRFTGVDEFGFEVVVMFGHGFLNLIKGGAAHRPYGNDVHKWQV